MTDKQEQEPTFLMCPPVEGFPGDPPPGATQLTCEHCECLVYVAPSSVALMATTDVTIACIPCARAKIEAEPDGDHEFRAVNAAGEWVSVADGLARPHPEVANAIALDIVGGAAAVLYGDPADAPPDLVASAVARVSRSLQEGLPEGFLVEVTRRATTGIERDLGMVPASRLRAAEAEIDRLREALKAKGGKA